MTTDITTFGKLWDLMDEAASKLAHNMRHGYTHGYESQLTAQLIADLDEHERHELLTFLAQDKMRDFACGGDQVLDECATESYEATDKMADILLDAIRKQGASATATASLLCSEITDRARMDVESPDIDPSLTDAMSTDAMAVTF